MSFEKLMDGDESNSYSVLCSELAVKLIDQPFITESDDREEWAL